MVRLLLVLHITAAAVWLGHKALIPFDLKKSLSPQPAVFIGLLDRLKVAEQLAQGSAVLTLVSGLLLVWLRGGFAAVSGGVQIDLGIVVLMFVLGALFGRPVSIRLRVALAGQDAEAARNEGRSLSELLTVESALWVAALATMVW